MEVKSLNAANMKPQFFVSVFRQALKTFMPPKSEAFQGSFIALKEKMDKVRAADIGLDDTYFQNFVINKKSDAPCTYIEVHEDKNINISVFILKPDFSLPLHDHPHMHGLLKMVWGQAVLKSYSQIDNKSQIERLKSSMTPQWRDPRYSRSIITKLMEEKVCNPDSECCVLTPHQSNFHEITAVGGYAAFLDILAPPYSSQLDCDDEVIDDETRDCHYFEIDHNFGEKLYHFSEIPPPPDFYCSQAPYVGPELSQT